MDRHPVSTAAADDLAQIEALLRAESLPVAGVPELLGDLLVVRHAGRLAGVAGLEIHAAEGLLRSLVVDPSSRGEGMGAALVRAGLKHARGRGLTRVHLLTETAADYFASFGFVPVPLDEIPQTLRASPEFEGCRRAGAQAMRLVLE